MSDLSRVEISRLPENHQGLISNERCLAVMHGLGKWELKYWRLSTTCLWLCCSLQPCLPQRHDQELWDGDVPLKGRRDDQIGLHRYA